MVTRKVKHITEYNGYRIVPIPFAKGRKFLFEVGERGFVDLRAAMDWCDAQFNEQWKKTK